MKEAITAKVEGVELVLCASDPQPGDVELWQSWGGWDGPNDPAPISVWPQRIEELKAACNHSEAMALDYATQVKELEAKLAIYEAALKHIAHHDTQMRAIKALSDANGDKDD